MVTKTQPRDITIMITHNKTQFIAALSSLEDDPREHKIVIETRRERSGKLLCRYTFPPLTRTQQRTHAPGTPGYKKRIKGMVAQARKIPAEALC